MRRKKPSLECTTARERSIQRSRVQLYPAATSCTFCVWLGVVSAFCIIDSRWEMLLGFWISVYLFDFH